MAFLRGAWGDPDELFASFKAGDMLAHHDHYNTGTLQHSIGRPAGAVDGRLRRVADYAGAYRLGYAIQTVASNSLLVLAPGRHPRRCGATVRAWTALSGGQRVISPTGFDCVNLDHYKRLLKSGRLERAEITAFESVAGRGDYIAADITAAYNSTRYSEPGSEAKVSLVTRQFLYLRRERAFVVFDRVETTRPEYTPKFLLHALVEAADRERTAVGRAGRRSDGILETQRPRGEDRTASAAC